MQGEWKNPWPKPPLLMDDAERCRVVDSYKIVDTDAEAVFDRLCGESCGTRGVPVVRGSAGKHRGLDTLERVSPTDVMAK